MSSQQRKFKVAFIPSLPAYRDFWVYLSNSGTNCSKIQRSTPHLKSTALHSKKKCLQRASLAFKCWTASPVNNMFYVSINQNHTLFSTFPQSWITWVTGTKSLFSSAQSAPWVSLMLWNIISYSFLNCSCNCLPQKCLWSSSEWIQAILFAIVWCYFFLHSEGFSF